MKKWTLFTVAVLAILSLLPCFAAAAAEAETVEAGDTIIFGHYEQDNNKNNGKEPIEWLVLDVQDGNALLISRYWKSNQKRGVITCDIMKTVTEKPLRLRSPGNQA